MAFDTEEVIKFGPEMAGERVGWISTEKFSDDKNDNNAPVSLNLVTATVGPYGASFSIERSHYPNGEIGSPIPAQYGFRAVYAISALLVSTEKEDWSDESHFLYQNESEGGEGNLAHMLYWGVARGMSFDDDGVVDWAKSRDDLLDLLKGKLTDVGFKEKYTKLYYWLNGSIARFGNNHFYPFVSFSLDDLLLPDKNMKKKTALQVKNAEGIARTLEHVADHDTKMRKRLTVFSDIPRETVPDRFIDNRRFAARSEDAIQDHLSNIAVRKLVDLPIGFRTEGRTWPYMDASQPDEHKAFGRELEGLRNGNIEPADSELQREINELRLRQQYAQDGLQRFNQIARLEAAKK